LARSGSSDREGIPLGLENMLRCGAPPARAGRLASFGRSGSGGASLSQTWHAYVIASQWQNRTIERGYHFPDHRFDSTTFFCFTFVRCTSANEFPNFGRARALFSSWAKFFFNTVALSFVCGNYYPIMD